MISMDDRERTEREAAALADGNNTVQLQNRYFDRDGEVHWLEWASVPLPDEQIIYGVARDVSERKEMEEEPELTPEPRRRVRVAASIESRP